MKRLPLIPDFYRVAVIKVEVDYTQDYNYREKSRLSKSLPHEQVSTEKMST